MTTIYPVRLEQADGPHGEGGERMTEVQALKLRELAEALGESFDAALTRRQAALRRQRRNLDRGIVDDGGQRRIVQAQPAEP